MASSVQISDVATSGDGQLGVVTTPSGTQIPERQPTYSRASLGLPGGIANAVAMAVQPAATATQTSYFDEMWDRWLEWLEHQRARENYSFEKMRSSPIICLLALWHTFALWQCACFLVTATSTFILSWYIDWYRLRAQHADAMFDIGFSFSILMRSWILVDVAGELLRFCFLLARSAWHADAFDIYRLAVCGDFYSVLSEETCFSSTWVSSPSPEGQGRDGLLQLTLNRRTVREARSRGIRTHPVRGMLLQGMAYLSFDAVPLAVLVWTYCNTGKIRASAVNMNVALLTAACFHVGAFYLAWTITDVCVKIQLFPRSNSLSFEQEARTSTFRRTTLTSPAQGARVKEPTPSTELAAVSHPGRSRSLADGDRPGLCTPPPQGPPMGRLSPAVIVGAAGAGVGTRYSELVDWRPSRMAERAGQGGSARMRRTLTTSVDDGFRFADNCCMHFCLCMKGLRAASNCRMWWPWANITGVLLMLAGSHFSSGAMIGAGLFIILCFAAEHCQHDRRATYAYSADSQEDDTLVQKFEGSAVVVAAIILLVGIATDSLPLVGIAVVIVLYFTMDKCRLKHRRRVHFTYTLEQQSKVPLLLHLDALRKRRGVPKDIWEARLAIRDRHGQELDLPTVRECWFHEEREAPGNQTSSHEYFQRSLGEAAWPLQVTFPAPLPRAPRPKGPREAWASKCCNLDDREAEAILACTLCLQAVLYTALHEQPSVISLVGVAILSMSTIKLLPCEFLQQNGFIRERFGPARESLWNWKFGIGWRLFQHICAIWFNYMYPGAIIQRYQFLLFLLAISTVRQFGLACRNPNAVRVKQIAVISLNVILVIVVLVVWSTMAFYGKESETSAFCEAGKVNKIDSGESMQHSCVWRKTFHEIPHKAPTGTGSTMCNMRFAMGDPGSHTLSLTDFGFFSAIAYESEFTVTEALQHYFPGWSTLHKRRPHFEDGNANSSDWITFFEFEDPSRSMSVLAIRGTDSMLDILDDINIWAPAFIIQSFGLGHGILLPGARTEADAVWFYLRGKLHNKYFDILLEYVQRRRREEPKRRFYLTGHSLGGGLAKIVASATGLQAITFMAPGLAHTNLVVLGHHFYHQLGEQTLTVVPQHDFVSRVDDHVGTVIPVRCDGNGFSCHALYPTLCAMLDLCGSGRDTGESVSIPCGNCKDQECPDSFMNREGKGGDEPRARWKGAKKARQANANGSTEES